MDGIRRYSYSRSDHFDQTCGNHQQLDRQSHQQKDACQIGAASLLEWKDQGIFKAAVTNYPYHDLINMIDGIDGYPYQYLTTMPYQLFTLGSNKNTAMIWSVIWS